MEKKEIKRLDLALDPGSPIPIYEQIKARVKQAVLSGELRDGDQVTPIRELAAQLKVNPNTIVKVYYQLEVEGYLKAQLGSGIFVYRDPAKTAADQQEIFRRLTDEYVARASGLGYSLGQMAEEIGRRRGGKGVKGT